MSPPKMVHKGPQQPLGGRVAGIVSRNNDNDAETTRPTNPAAPDVLVLDGDSEPVAEEDENAMVRNEGSGGAAAAGAAAPIDVDHEASKLDDELDTGIVEGEEEYEDDDVPHSTSSDDYGKEEEEDADDDEDDDTLPPRTFGPPGNGGGMPVGDQVQQRRRSGMTPGGTPSLRPVAAVAPPPDLPPLAVPVLSTLTAANGGKEGTVVGTTTVMIQSTDELARSPLVAAQSSLDAKEQQQLQQRRQQGQNNQERQGQQQQQQQHQQFRSTTLNLRTTGPQQRQEMTASVHPQLPQQVHTVVGNSASNPTQDEQQRPKESPITSLSMSSFEKTFRLKVIRPLNNIINNSPNQQQQQQQYGENNMDVILEEIRWTMNDVMCGIYTRAHEFYAGQDVSSLAPSKHATSATICTKEKNDNGDSIKNNNDGIRDSVPHEHVSKIQIEKKQQEQQQQQHYRQKEKDGTTNQIQAEQSPPLPQEGAVSLNNIKFADAASEIAARHKLLPHAIRLLLKIGLGGHHCQPNRGYYHNNAHHHPAAAATTTVLGIRILSLRSEQIVGRMLLDFAELSGAMLDLGAACSGLTGNDGEEEVGRKERVQAEHHCHDGGNGGGRGGTREEEERDETTEKEHRGVAEQQAAEGDQHVVRLNVLDYMGHEYLDALCRTLASEAWECAVKQRQLNHGDSGEGVLLLPVAAMLPPFYQAYVGLNVCDVSNYGADRLLPWQSYGLPRRVGLNGAIGALRGVVGLSSHHLAFSKSLLLGGTVEALAALLLVPPTSIRMERPSIPSFKAALCIHRSLLCAVSYLSVEAVEMFRQQFEQFDSAEMAYLCTVNVSHLSKSEDRRILLSILAELWESSVGDKKERVLKIRLQTLWTFIAGDGGPTLSCQIMGLNELRDIIRETEVAVEDARRRFEEEEIHEERHRHHSNVDGDEHNGQADNEDHSVLTGEDNSEMPALVSRHRSSQQEQDKRLVIIGPHSPPQKYGPAMHDADGRGGDRDDNSSTGAACCSDVDMNENDDDGNGGFSRGSSSSVTSLLHQQEVDEEFQDDNECVSHRVSKGAVSSVPPSVAGQTEPALPPPTLTQLRFMGSREVLLSLLSFVTNFGLLRRILNTAPHPELLKRLLPILIFLARNQHLTNSDLTLLWNASGLTSPSDGNGGGSSHESVTHGILDLLAGLLDEERLDGQLLLTTENMRHLVCMLKSVDGGRYDTRVLDLVIKMAHRSLDAIMDELSETGEVFGLDMLWELSSEQETQFAKTTFCVKDDVRKAAVTGFLKLSERVAKNACLEVESDKYKGEWMMRKVQTDIIHRALRGLKPSKSTVDGRRQRGGDVTCVKVLCIFLRIIPMIGRDDESFLQFRKTGMDCLLSSLHELLSQCDLIDLIITELTQYASSWQDCDSFAPEATKSKDEKALVDDDRDCDSREEIESILDDNTYKLAIESRLELLELVVERGLELSLVLSSQSTLSCGDDGSVAVVRDENGENLSSSPVSSGSEPMLSGSFHAVGTRRVSLGNFESTRKRRKRMIHRNYDQPSNAGNTTCDNSSMSTSTFGMATSSGTVGAETSTPQGSIAVVAEEESDSVPRGIPTDTNGRKDGVHHRMDNVDANVNIAKSTIIHPENDSTVSSHESHHEPSNLDSAAIALRAADKKGEMLPHNPIPRPDHIRFIWERLILRGKTTVAIDQTLRTLHAILLLIGRKLDERSERNEQNTQSRMAVPRHVVICLRQWTDSLIGTLFSYTLELPTEKLRTAGYELFVYCLGRVNVLGGLFQIIEESIDNDDTVMEMNMRSKAILGAKESTMERMTGVLLGMAHYDVPHDDGKNNTISSSNSARGGTNVHCKSPHDPCLSSGSGSRNLIRIVEYDIKGRDKMLSVALSAADVAVSHMAMVYLATLYTYPQSHSDGMQLMAKEHRIFVRRCMISLRHDDSSDRIANGDQVRKIRVLRLIRIFAEFALRSRAVSSRRRPSGEGDNGHHHQAFSSSHGYTTNTKNGGAPAVHQQLSAARDIGDGVSVPSSGFVVHLQPIGIPPFPIVCPQGEWTTLGYFRYAVRELARRNQKSGRRNDMFSSAHLSSVENGGHDVANENEQKRQVEEAYKTGDVTDYRLIYNGKEIKGPDTDPLVTVGIEHNSTVHCCPRLATAGYKKAAAVNCGRKKSGISWKDEQITLDLSDSYFEEDGPHVEQSDQPSKRRKQSQQAPKSLTPPSLIKGENEKRKEEEELPLSSGGSFLRDSSLSGIRELVTPLHMQQFFSILSEEGPSDDCDDSVSDRSALQLDYSLKDFVWDLLQLLPSDPRMRDALLSLEDRTSHQQVCEGQTDGVVELRVSSFDWDAWLPPPTAAPSSSSTPYRLLYGLQLVEALTVRCFANQKTCNSLRANKSVDRVVNEDQEVGEAAVDELTRAKKKGKDMIDDITDSSGGGDKLRALNGVGERETPGKNSWACESESFIILDDDDDEEDISESNKRPSCEGNTIRDQRDLSRTWCSRFVDYGGLEHLISLLMKIDLSDILPESNGFDPSHRSQEAQYLDSTSDHDQEISLPRCSSTSSVLTDRLVLLRCANRLLRLICVFLENDDVIVDEKEAVSKIRSMLGPLLRHTLKLTHWSVVFQQLSLQQHKQGNFLKELSRGSSLKMSAGGVKDAADQISGCSLRDKKGSGVSPSLPSPSSLDSNFTQISSSVFAKNSDRVPPSVLCFEEGGNAVCQCLALIKNILSFSKVFLVNNGRDWQALGGNSSFLFPYVRDPGCTETLGVTRENGVPYRSVSSLGILSNAIASSLVKSPSENVRCLAMSTLRTIFNINRKSKLTSFSTQVNSGPIVSHDASSHGDDRAQIQEPQYPAQTIDVLSVLVSLLPMGARCPAASEEDNLMSRCSNLFDLVTDLISAHWDKSCKEIRSRAIQGFISCFEEKLCGNERADGIANAVYVIETGSVYPPECNGMESVGLLLYWIMRQVTNLPNREKRLGAEYSSIPLQPQQHQADGQIQEKQIVDYYLVGLLKLAKEIVEMMDCVDVKAAFSRPLSSSDERDFLQILFDKCAFTLPQSCSRSPSETKWLSLQTRGAALALLLELCRECEINVRKMARLLQSRHHPFESSDPRKDIANDWHFDPLLRQKSLTGHVGMKNQGATCYMNSLLQQFFLIRPLREGVLSCGPLDNELMQTENVEESDYEGERRLSDPSEQQRDENVLYQLQLLFSHLLVSERRDYDTRNLVASIKGYDGIPMRPGEQQDVDEFFNLFCDRLETALKPLPQKCLLQDTFGGELCHVISCQECKHRSERKEDCLALSLDVKGKKSILDSLDLYIQGEALSGVFCSNCRSKQDSVKMCCISALPNYLILHLKRFEFDLELMRKIKVNDRCEFPMELNMKPYTKEGLSPSSGAAAHRPEQYYQYFLRGVLVHTGTADSGHYYSLARDDSRIVPAAKSECEGVSGGHSMESEGFWYCFNDSSVTPFDPTTLPEATFGGTKITNKYDPLTQKMQPTEAPKPFSAYLLFYERKHVEFRNESAILEAESISWKKNEMEVSDDPQANKDEIQKANLLDSAIMSSWHPPFDQVPKEPHDIIPTEIFKRLKEENDRFIRDQTFFAPEYSNWLLNVADLSCPTLNCGSLSSDHKNYSTGKPVLEMIQVLTCHLFENLVHAKDRGKQIEAFTLTLCRWYSESVEGCCWLLGIMCGKYRTWAETILLRCPVVETRHSFVRIISAVFLTMTSDSAETSLYDVEVEEHLRESHICHDETNVKRAEKDEFGSDDDDESIRDGDDDIVKTFLPRGQQAMTSTRISRVRWWKSKSIVARFIGTALLELLEGCEYHWKRFDQLFECIIAFAMCGHQEAIYLIRCGLVLRLVDIYLGEFGGVPAKSLVVRKGKSRSQKSATERRCKMGDKYSKPNILPLLSLLDLLIRSVIVMPDDVVYSDSDSDPGDAGSDEKGHNNAIKPSSIVQKASGQLHYDGPVTLTHHAKSVIRDKGIRFEMPRRDAAHLSTKIFFETLCDEIPQTNHRLVSVGPIASVSGGEMGSPSSFPVAILASRIVSHVCFENIELSRMFCSVAQRVLEDRKADEFVTALESLTSLLQFNDQCVLDRVTVVMDTLVAGISCNLKYEKETVVLLGSIRAVLSKRTGATHGTSCEILLYTWMLSHLKKQILDEWFRRPNTSAEVRESILDLIKSLVPPDESDVAEDKKGTGSVECQRKRQPIGGGCDQGDAAIPSKRRRKARHHGAKDNKIEDAMDLKAGSSVISLPPPSPVRPSRLDKESDKSVVKESENDEVVILGVVKNTLNSVENRDKRHDQQHLTQPGSDNVGNSASHTSSDVDRSSSSEDCMLDKYPPGAREHIFEDLISIFSEVSDAVKSQASKGSGKTYRNSRLVNSSTYQNGVIDSSFFASYFATLCACLTGSESEKRLILHNQHKGIHRKVLSLLWKIDEEGRQGRRPAADIAKGELIVFYRRVVEMHREVGQEFVSNFRPNTSSSARTSQAGNAVEADHNVCKTNMGEDSSDSGSEPDVTRGRKNNRGRRGGVLNRKKRNNHDECELSDRNIEDRTDHILKLLEIYVTSCRANEDYNNTFMAHYYGLMVLLSKRHEVFRKKMLKHENWKWSLRAFVTGPTGLDSGPVYDTILNGTMHFAETDGEFRKDLVLCLTQSYDANKRSCLTQSRLETSSLRLLRTIFTSEYGESEEDGAVATFIDEDSQGMSQLSAAVAKFHDRLGDKGGARSKTGIIHSSVVLEGLALSLECIYLVLESLDLNQVRSLMSSWPEVDDINFICTQIVSRTEEEWESSFDSSVSNGRQTAALRAVGYATELRKIFSSIEAVAEAEEE